MSGPKRQRHACHPGKTGKNRTPRPELGLTKSPAHSRTSADRWAAGHSLAYPAEPALALVAEEHTFDDETDDFFLLRIGPNPNACWRGLGLLEVTSSAKT